MSKGKAGISVAPLSCANAIAPLIGARIFMPWPARRLLPCSRLLMAVPLVAVQWIKPVLARRPRWTLQASAGGAPFIYGLFVRLRRTNNP